MLKKVVGVNNQVVQLNVWDTAGQEKYRSISSQYLRGSAVVFAVFDMTQKETLQSLKHYWIERVQQEVPEAVIFMLGNKQDLDNGSISVEQVKFVAEQNKIEFDFCSAFTGENVEGAFLRAAKLGVSRAEEERKKMELLQKQKACC